MRSFSHQWLIVTLLSVRWGYKMHSVRAQVPWSTAAHFDFRSNSVLQPFHVLNFVFSFKFRLLISMSSVVSNFLHRAAFVAFPSNRSLFIALPCRYVYDNIWRLAAIAKAAIFRLQGVHYSASVACRYYETYPFVTYCAIWPSGFQVVRFQSRAQTPSYFWGALSIGNAHGNNICKIIYCSCAAEKHEIWHPEGFA